MKNESGALENTFEIVGKKLSNMIPKNKKISTLDFNSIINTKRTVEDNSYIDLPSSPMVYYNDAVERIGQNLLTGINNTPGNFSGTTEKMVHKAPVKIPLSKDDDDRDVYEGQSVLESQLLGKSYASMQQGNNRNKLSSNKNVMNEEKTKRLIKDYVSELDLNIDSISRKVMNRIEKIMKTDRRRFGMFR